MITLVQQTHIYWVIETNWYQTVRKPLNRFVYYENDFGEFE